MSIFHFFQRYTFFIVFLTLFLGFSGWYYASSQVSNKFVSTLFFTVATQDSSNPEQAEVASTYFGETLIGWFRNPVFLSSIKAHAQDDFKSISAYKQERQNLLVEIHSMSKEGANNVSESILEVLEKELIRYNNASGSSFVIIDQGRTLRTSQGAFMLYPLAGLVLGLFLSIFLLLLKELLRDEISSIAEAEQILDTHTMEFLKKDFEKNDYTLLSTAIQKLDSLLILAGVSVDTELLAIALSHKQSFFGEKIALVDGDLCKRNLHHRLGVSSRMKNLKGHTDASLKDSRVIASSIIIQNTHDDNIKMVVAGRGEKFLSQVFINLAKKMKTLIHTQLPENTEVLRLDNAVLLLVIEVGKTKKRDLQKIRQVWKGELKLIVVE
ncbi:hypothetical protein HON22_02140 [Candidatus Peregrinibacteria bacterium]|jgi:hypothetical protein|nr:hypothetical protein [Candidatus Peregrinibacteria bacterium]